MLLSSWLQQAEQSMATVPGRRGRRSYHRQGSNDEPWCAITFDRTGGLRVALELQHDCESDACAGRKGEFECRTSEITSEVRKIYGEAEILIKLCARRCR